MSADHYRRLEKLYAGAPTNEYYRPVIRIDDGVAEIEVTIRPDFHHAARAVHGSVYFKLLDDAGFFAVNSIVEDVLVLTANFTIHLLRPVEAGVLVARGRVVNRGKRQFLADAQLFDGDQQLVAHGVGAYVSSRIALDDEVGYSR